MDLAIVTWVSQNLHHPFLDWLMPLITFLGEGGLIWIAITLILLARKKTRRAGVLCAMALLLTTLLGEGILKNIIQRPRPFTLLPDQVLLIAPPHSFSFPSGHSGSSFATATALFFSDHKKGVWAFLPALLIAFSRLYLLVHYPTDILAGAALGIFSAFLARWILTKMEKSR